jgi:lariat debranching enzyme
VTPSRQCKQQRPAIQQQVELTVPLHPQIAVEGCCHGELDTIYSTLQHLEQKEGKKIDLLICCGDFQVQ